jgi:hypothetical protein
MSTPQEILQSMIDSAPVKSADIANSITAIDAQIADFQAKQDAMKQGVGDVATTRLEDYLKTLYPVSDYHQKNGTTYNAIETASGTLTDWKIYKLVDLDDITFKTDTQFICRGDKESVFKKDDDVGFTIGSAKEYSTVADDAVYTPDDPENPFPDSDFTTVDINDNVLDSSLSEVWKFETSYAPGDITIDELVSQWNFAHDYIVTPLGLATGTYGTQDNIAKLTDAKNMLNTNKAKVDSTSASFGPFT